MGIKGDKNTLKGEATKDEIIEILNPSLVTTSKKMFGGFGIFCEKGMFLIVDSKGAVSIKATEPLSRKFESEGWEKHGKMPYYSIPETILEDNKELVSLAKETIENMS